jgi:hypothetical protein
VTFRDFICDHLQLDELMTRVKKDGERVWLLLHVEWVRSYYHFARPHMALKRVYVDGRNQYLTPAVAAGVAKRPYEVRELLLIALYPEPG